MLIAPMETVTGEAATYESIFRHPKVRLALAVRASLLPVTAASLPAGLLVAAIFTVVTRNPEHLLMKGVTAAFLCWAAGLLLFARQNLMRLKRLGEVTYRFDSERFRPEPGKPDSPAGSLNEMAEALNQNRLDPIQLPADGYVPHEYRTRVNRIPASRLLIGGLSPVRDLYMAGELAADGTPVWDLRTKLVKEIEDRAWKLGSLTDPGWHTRPG